MESILSKIRPKESQKALETMSGIMASPDAHGTTVAAEAILASALEETQETTPIIGPSVIQDLSLDPSGVTWATINKTHLAGGAILLRKIIEAPTNDATLLRNRQESIRTLAASTALPQIIENLESLRTLEPDALWTQSAPDIKAAWPIPMIFPTWPILSYINYSPTLLGLYHLYRCVLSPLMSAVSPISSALGPYFYLRYKLGLNIALTFYVKILISLIVQSKYTSFIYLIVFGYIALYAYGIFCNIELALMVANLRSALYNRAMAIKTFIATAYQTIALAGGPHASRFFYSTPPASSPPPPPPPTHASITDIYHYWTNPTKREEMRTLLQMIYAIDVCVNATKLVNQCMWTIVHFKGPSAHTIIHDMKHPGLAPAQVANPASLSKSLIVTGPNAAGKSTYVKAILCNILFAQSLGIAYSTKMESPIWDGIHSYMRVWDTPGEESLFEAEMSRCRQVLEAAAAAEAAGKRAIFFLDEPMHSTPPIEGAATAKAMVKHLASMDGIRVVVTTHFHTIIDLPLNLARNISMEAVPVTGATSKTFTFPYKIRKGGSRQCIALELLKENALPDSVIADAIKYKNIICKES